MTKPVQTAAQDHFAVIAVRKLKAGEPINPKSLTCDHVGQHARHLEAMLDQLRFLLGNTEGSEQVRDAAIKDAMETYWLSLRQDPQAKVLVEVVDASDLKDAADIPTAKRARPMIVHADQVQEEPMQWLWWPYLPRDMVVMVDGDPGLGKSMMLLQVASNLSRALPFLDQQGKPTLYADVEGPQTTLILSAEESIPQVMIPRLRAYPSRPACLYVMSAHAICKNAT